MFATASSRDPALFMGAFSLATDHGVNIVERSVPCS